MEDKFECVNTSLDMVRSDWWLIRQLGKIIP
jgi:hypothetical protein